MSSNATTGTTTFEQDHGREPHQAEAAVVAHLASSENFAQYFAIHREPLGSGTDGLVLACEHRSTRRFVAVKIPHADCFWTSVAIADEAKVLAKLDKHENIVHMLAFQPDFGDTFCPAIFSDCAEFGNLLDYREHWRGQEARQGRAYGVAEATVWKLFKDMVLALDYLHNECGFIHRDVKSENVLVTCPADYTGELIPTVPVFKLCDFSRAVVYPSPEGEFHAWSGTLEYAPPPNERDGREPARPAGDMWALGATLQEFALGMLPLQSRKAFVAKMKKHAEPHPELDNEEKWKQEIWRLKLSAVYRPLNVPEKEVMDRYDVVKPMASSFKPFSNALNEWYAKLWETNHKLRVTAASLAKDLVPLIDGYVGADMVENAKCRKDSMQPMQTITRPLSPLRARAPSYESNVYGPKFKMRKPRARDQPPSYEGNDYPTLSDEIFYLPRHL